MLYFKELDGSDWFCCQVNDSTHLKFPTRSALKVQLFGQEVLRG